MNRRQMLAALPALALAPRLRSEPVLKARLQAGLVAYSYRKQFESKKMTYEGLIGHVADLGLDGIDTTVYWFPDTSDQFLAKLRSTAYKNAVSLYSAAVRVRLAQPTADLQRAEFENACKWIDVAEKIGASHVRVFGGNIPAGATEAQAIGWAVEVLKRSADYAGRKGIVLGLEDDGGLTTTAEPTIEIVKRTASPYAGINLDTGNFPKNGYAQVEMCIPYAVNVHFKTHIAAADGSKEVADWDRLIGMFVKGGYRGYLSLEYEEPESAEVAVPKFAAQLRDKVAAFRNDKR